MKINMTSKILIIYPKADVSSTKVSSSVSSDRPDSTKSSEILSEILVLPEPKVKETYKKTKSISVSYHISS